MDDVRVRLSAEGVDDILAAIRKVKTEAEKTGGAGAQYFAQWRKEIEAVGTSLVGMVAAGAIVAKIKSLADEVSNTAVQMSKMHQATGLSTDALQVYTKAAGKSDEAQAALSKGLSFFTRVSGQAALGSKSAVQGFSDLNINVKQFAGLNADQKLQLVSERMLGIEDPSKRAAVGFELFGRSFQQMYPILVRVNNEGFGPMLQRMKELGVYMDSEMIERMRGVKRSMGEMGEISKGVVTQFLSGLLPGVQSAMDGILKSTNSAGVNGFEKLGEWVGWLVNVVQKSMSLIGALVGETFGRMTVFAQQQIEVLTSKAGLLEKAKAFAKLANPSAYVLDAASNGDFSGTKQAAGDLWKALSQGPDKQAKKEGPEPEATDVQPRNLQALAEARLHLIEAQLQAELKIYDAQSKLKLDKEKEAYEAGKLSLEQYFADREEITNRRFDKELEILKRQRAAVAATPIAKNDDGTGALRRQAELARLDGDIATKQLERTAALSQLATEQHQAQRQHYQESLKAEEELLKLQGKRADAARLQLQLDLEALRVQLQKSGRDKSEIDATLSKYQSQAEAKISFDEAKRDADATLMKLNTKIKEIQDQVKDGVLFPIQGEQKIIDLEKQRLPVLEDTAKKLARIAEATGDEQTKAEAEKFAQAVRDIKTATNETGQAMAEFKRTAQDALQNGVANFLYDLSSGASSVSDAFRNMALSFVQSLAKMESEYLSKQFIKWLNGGAGGEGGGEGGGGGFLSGISSFIGGFFATGGLISGPGTGTSDSVPVMASAGEFVVKAEAVQKPGVLALLHAINGTPGVAARGAPGVQHFAGGGAVGAAASSQSLRIVNVLDPAMVGDYISSAAGEKVVMNVMRKNPGLMRQILGG